MEFKWICPDEWESRMCTGAANWCVSMLQTESQLIWVCIMETWWISIVIPGPSSEVLSCVMLWALYWAGSTRLQILFKFHWYLIHMMLCKFLDLSYYAASSIYCNWIELANMIFLFGDQSGNIAFLQQRNILLSGAIMYDSYHCSL